VILAFLELEFLGQITNLAIDTDAHEAGLADILEDVLKLAFATLDQRRQDHDARALGHLEHRVDDLLRRLLRDRPMALRAMWMTGSRSRGKTRSMFLRLCCFAPRISILSSGTAT